VQVRWIESDWLVYDLDSTNGTFVDGERVPPERPRALRAGMLLRLGDHDLSVADRDE
jgi:pSer/pThr/pTyr-binding forkhead associated (FHA) protein